MSLTVQELQGMRARLVEINETGYELREKRGMSPSIETRLLRICGLSNEVIELIDHEVE